MSAVKHTPGPWRDGGREHEGRINVVSDDGYYIANVIGGMSIETEQANARLIIASPILLAALLDVLETFSLGPLGAAAKYGPDVDLRAMEEAAVTNARAAIAEATGQ